MAETRFYHALTAEAFADAGKFVLCGRKLRPFSLLHSAQLDQLNSPLWCGNALPELTDLDIAAQICASDKPVVTFEPLVIPHDSVEELDRWENYLEVCAAKPMLKDRVGQAVGSTLQAPVEMMIASYLLRMSRLTEERIWRMPYGLALWYVESIREQETGDSMILTEEEASELDALNSEDGKAKRKEQEATALAISEALNNRGITDPTERKRRGGLRVKLLNALAQGMLDPNWKESLHG